MKKSNYYKLVKEIDLLDSNYSLSKKEINYISSISKNRKIFSGVFWGMIRFSFSIINSLFKQIKNFGKVNSFNTVVIFAGSRNQYNTLKPVYNAYKNATLIGTGDYGEVQLNIFLSRIYSIFYFGVLLKLYKTLIGYEKQSVKYLFDRYLGTYGFYLYSFLLFKRHREIKVLVLANDHSMRCRVLNKTAKENGVKTIFIQHASANMFFPKLNFDYACLDGVEAYNVYKAIGNSKTKILITGNSKLDENILKNKKRKNSLIGLCFNPNDNKVEILNVLNNVIKRFDGSQIIVRPHPNDRKYEYFKKYCLSKSIHFSPSKKQNAFEFFQNVNLIIAGESNIHLEAASFNIPSIYYPLGNYNKIDWYGFIENGIIKFKADKAVNLIEIIEYCLSNNMEVRENAEKFYKNLNPKYFGTAVKQIISIIDEAKCFKR